MAVPNPNAPGHKVRPAPLKCRRLTNSAQLAILQFAPELAKVESNIARADAILERDIPQGAQIDWLILPEMAFSGK